MIDLSFFVSSKVKRNSVANLARVLLGLPLSILFTYFVLQKLSLSDYGTWVLAFAFFAYFSLLDLGIANAITRLVSLENAAGKTKEISRVINTSLFFYALTGALIVLAVFALAEPLTLIFFKNAQVDNSIQIAVLKWVVLMGFVNFCFSSFSSALNGLQRMELTNLIDLGKTLIFTISGFLALSLKPDLYGLTIAFSISIITTCLLSLLFFRAVFPAYSFSFRDADFPLFKKMISYGAKTQFSQIAVFIHLNFDKFLVAYFLGVDKVGFLEIGGKIINQARLLVSSLISPLLPAATEKMVKFGSQVQKFYANSFNYVAAFAALVFSAVFLLSPLFIKIWLGPGFALAAGVAQILALGHFINMITGPTLAILLARNQLKPLIIASATGAVANIIFSLVGINLFGLYGSVAGTSLALILSGILFLLMGKPYLKRAFA